MTRARTTSVSKALGSFVVCVHASEAPSDAEWDQFLSLLRVQPEARKRILIFTLGGAPDARQRGRLYQALGETKPPIAVLTPSAVARATVTAISWFNPSIRAFDPDATQKALDYLDATQAERGEVLRALTELRRQLGV